MEKHITAPLGLLQILPPRWGYKYYRPAGATNMGAPLGLYLNRLIHQTRQKNVPRLFEFLVLENQIF